MKKMLSCSFVLAALVIAAPLFAIAYQDMRSNNMPKLSTPYQSVALMNGSLYFGRMDNLDAGYVVLRDVFYIQSRQDSESKQVTNTLIKRGGEAHSPDRMYINR